MEKRKILPIVLIVVSIALAVLGYFLLPDQVVIQFSSGAAGNSTAPKPLAILIPTSLGIIGGVMSLFSKENNRVFWKSVFVSLIGIFVGIFMIVIHSFCIVNCQ